MKNLLLLITLCAVFIATASSAQTAGWSANTRIFDLRVFNGIEVYAQALDTNLSDGCPTASTNFQRTTFILDTESPFFDQTYSILLAAQASGREVQLYRSGDCSNNGTFAVVNGARLRN